MPLPFDLTATLKERPNTTVEASVPVAIWPARVRPRDGGDHYDHEGEAPLEHHVALAVPNRFLEVGGERYVVVEAQRNDYLPHVALRLRRTKSSGV
jgi:hypothetical protein